MNRILLGAVLLLTLVGGASITSIYIRSFYPANVSNYEKEYQELVRLTLACCFGNDYWRSLEELVSEGDTERVALMRKLGVTDVHSYPGNPEYPGGVVRLERRLGGPFITMYVYSLKRHLSPSPGCYKMEHVHGRWYRGNTFLCLFWCD